MRTTRTRTLAQLRENVEFVMDGLEAATQAARNPNGSNIQVAYSLPPEGGSGFGDLPLVCPGLAFDNSIQ